MKRTLVLILCIIFCQNIFAQTNELVKIADKNKCKLVVLHEYNDSGSITDYTYSFVAQNEKYELISDTFIISFGTPQNVYNSLILIKEFSEKYKGKYRISSKQGDLNLYHCNILGSPTTQITIDGKYVYLRDSNIDYFIKKLLAYCSKNNIEITQK